MSQLPRHVRRLNSCELRLQKSGEVVLPTCYRANDFMSRFMGLMGVSHLAPSEGLWLDPCRDIHMGFMRIAIDAVFVRPAPSSERQDASSFEITSLHPHLRPWKFVPTYDSKATSVIEMAAGCVSKFGLQRGDIIVCSS